MAPCEIGLFGQQGISRTQHAAASAIQDVRINHRRANINVSQQFLHCACRAGWRGRAGRRAPRVVRDTEGDRGVITEPRRDRRMEKRITPLGFAHDRRFVAGRARASPVTCPGGAREAGSRETHTKSRKRSDALARLQWNHLRAPAQPAQHSSEPFLASAFFVAAGVIRNVPTT